MKPNFDAFKAYMKKQKETEYYLAKKRGELSIHLRNENLTSKLL